MFKWVLNTPLEISMEIYQKTLVLILFIKEYKAGLRPLHNFRLAPILTQNDHKEYKKTNVTREYILETLYNEKEWKVKNIDIAFDPYQLFDQCKDFMDPRHRRQSFDPRQVFMSPRHPRQNFTHTTHATHAVCAN